MNFFQQWLHQPRSTLLRKAIFQLHLWAGLILGLYILLISITGSILVFSNELFRAATPEPIVVTSSAPPLTDHQLEAAATGAYPGYRVVRITHGPTPGYAVDISLKRGNSTRNRLFHPYTGADLGNSVPLGTWLISRTLDLHDNLLTGESGRRVNGVGAILIVLLAFTGLVVWWPGVASWRRSLIVRRRVGWQRLIWDLHSAIGFWLFAFILMFGLSGIYLGNPQPFQDLADRIEAPTAANAGTRLVDQVIYWLAYLHFGRVNGIGIPCSGPGVCDIATKTIWSILGLAPAAMFITGAVMWWNRVLRRKPR
jgi:uncharacterized iron-regulated membrane protein